MTNPRRPLDASRPGRRGVVVSGRIDGGARGNPGPAGIGVVLEEDGRAREEYYAYLGTKTNNVAEYAALLLLLARSVEREATELVVRSDSELLVKQMLGVYRVKNPVLQTLHTAARRQMARISKVTFRHVPREENREADLLANRAMDERDSSGPLPEELVALLKTADQGAFSFGGKG